MICTEWVYDELYWELGDNFGVAPLPSINIAGEEKPMRVFTDTQCIGVNAKTKHPKAAMELAAYLASYESQLLRFELHDTVPALRALHEDAAVQKSPLTVAMMESMEQSAAYWPDLEDMREYWQSMKVLCGGVVDGSIREDQAEATLDQLFTFKLKK